MPPQPEAMARMSDELVQHLQGPQPVLVTTLDAETNWPTNNLITWVRAIDGDTLRLVADATGRVIENIRADGRVLLTVMATGACHCIAGDATVTATQIEGPSLKLGMAEVKVRNVRDVMFWGGKLTAGPTYDVTYGQTTKEKLDRQVFDAMRGG